MANKMEVGDFGEKIGGARKDLAGFRKLGGFNINDIEDWSDVERGKNIVKKEVFVKPDYQKLYDSGEYTKEAVYFISRMYKALPARPESRYFVNQAIRDGKTEADGVREAQDAYIRLMNYFRDNLLKVHNENDIYSFSAVNGAFREEFRKDSDLYAASVFRGSKIQSEYVSSPFIMVYLKRNMTKERFLLSDDEIKLSYAEIYRYDGKNIVRSYMTETTLKGVVRNLEENENVYETHEGLRYFIDREFTASENDGEAFFKGTLRYTMKAKTYEDAVSQAEEAIQGHLTNGMYTWLKDAEIIGTRLSEGKDTPITLETENKTVYYYNITGDKGDLTKYEEGKFFALVKSGSGSGIRPDIIGFNFETEEEAKAVVIEYMTEKMDSFAKTKKPKKEKLLPPQLEHIRRTGTDWLSGGSVEVQKHGEGEIVTFSFPLFQDSGLSFRGVEFGNWENQNDRMTNINMAYDAFMDMTHVLGISPKDASLGGNLALAFGARGHGSALAHFEPAKNVINLTKMRGAGSLGHEWAHALDYAIARNESRAVNGRGGIYETDKAYRVESPLHKVMNAIKRKEDGGYTDFYRDAIAIDNMYAKTDKGYWQSDVELFARAFHTYLLDKLRAEGMRNDYLCGHAEQSAVTGSDGNNHYTYPRGEDRERINIAFDGLIEALKENGMFTGIEDAVTSQMVSSVDGVAAAKEITGETIAVSQETAPENTVSEVDKTEKLGNDTVSVPESSEDAAKPVEETEKQPAAEVKEVMETPVTENATETVKNDTSETAPKTEVKKVAPETSIEQPTAEKRKEERKGNMTDRGKHEPRSTQRDKTDELFKRMDAGIQDFFTSDKFKEYLNVMSKFHNYSLSNCTLIAIQRPDATLVAGYNDWQKKFSRHVMRGEKGIQILAPMQKIMDIETGETDADGNAIIEKISRTYFRPVYVFDVSQTEGKELPKIVDELTGAVDRYEDLIEALKKCTTAAVSFHEIDGSAKGYFNREDNTIHIQTGMSEMMTIKTLIHEIAHSRLHNKLALEDRKNDPTRGEKELEAEATAYVVCEHLGIDTSDYSFAYIGTWIEGKSLDEMKDSCKAIKSESKAMIEELERYMVNEQSSKLTKKKAEAAEITDIVKDKLQGAGIEADDVKTVVYNETVTPERLHTYVYNADQTYQADFILQGDRDKISQLLTDMTAVIDVPLDEYLRQNGISCDVTAATPGTYYDMAYNYMTRQLDVYTEKRNGGQISAVVSVKPSITDQVNEESLYNMLYGSFLHDKNLNLNPVIDSGETYVSDKYIERLDRYITEGYDTSWPMVSIVYSNYDKAPATEKNIYDLIEAFQKIPEEMRKDRRYYIKASIKYVYNDYAWELMQDVDLIDCPENFIDSLSVPENVKSHLKSHYALLELSDKVKNLAPGMKYSRAYADEVEEWADYCRVELNHNSDKPIIPRPPEIAPEYIENLKDWRMDR